MKHYSFVFLLFFCFVFELGEIEAQSNIKTSEQSAIASTSATSNTEAPSVSIANDVQQLQSTTAKLSPGITPGQQLTLIEALNQAKAQNLDLKVAKMEVVKARTRLSTAWGLIHPIAVGKFDYTHMDHDDTVDLTTSMAPVLDAMGITLPPDSDLGDPLLVNPQDKLMGSVDIMFPVINAHNWLTVKTAHQGVKVVEYSIEIVERQILLGVAQAYFMALTTRDLIDFYHSQIATTQEQLKIASARFNAGGGLRIDVIRAETDLEQAKQSLRSALLAFDNARDALGDLIGTQELPLPADSPELKVPAGSVPQLEKIAQHERLDIIAGTAKIELMDNQLTASWMKFLPTLNLVGHFGYQFTDMVDLGSQDRSRWAIMAAVTIPLYDYFRYAELDEKRALLAQAQTSLENIKNKASLSVRTAYRNYINALTDVATAKKQAALAKEGLSLVESSYRAGTATSLEVTQARQTHTAAGFNLTTSEFKAQLSLLSLLDTVGAELVSSIEQN